MVGGWLRPFPPSLDLQVEDTAVEGTRQVMACLAQAGTLRGVGQEAKWSWECKHERCQPHVSELSTGVNRH